MHLWFLFTSSWIVAYFPFNLIAWVLSPLFETLPAGAESSISTVFERAGVETRASWGQPEEVYPWFNLHPEPVMKILQPQLVARMINAAEKTMSSLIAAGGSISQVHPAKQCCRITCWDSNFIFLHLSSRPDDVCALAYNQCLVPQHCRVLICRSLLP